MAHYAIVNLQFVILLLQITKGESHESERHQRKAAGTGYSHHQPVRQIECDAEERSRIHGPAWSTAQRVVRKTHNSPGTRSILRRPALHHRRFHRCRSGQCALGILRATRNRSTIKGSKGNHSSGMEQHGGSSPNH